MCVDKHAGCARARILHDRARDVYFRVRVTCENITVMLCFFSAVRTFDHLDRWLFTSALRRCFYSDSFFSSSNRSELALAGGVIYVCLQCGFMLKVVLEKKTTNGFTRGRAIVWHKFRLVTGIRASFSCRIICT